MEILALIFGVFLVIVVLKLLFEIGIFLITLPFKIVGAVLLFLLLLLVFIPLGLAGGLAAIFVVPIAVLTPLLPVALIIIGLILWVRKSH